MYTLGPGGIPVPELDPVKWAESWRTTQRHVAITEIKDARVSTVFLGLDHGFGDGLPILWETMVFGGKLDGLQQRYSTQEEAERGHNEIVGRLTRAALPKSQS
jgi:hypothetical protein